MKEFEEIVDKKDLVEVEPEPTFEDIMANITNIQESWNKPQEEVPFEPYVPTQEELAEINKQKQINELKQKLAQTDYQAIKYAEGRMSGAEYAPIGEQRQAWRDEINNLEKQL